MSPAQRSTADTLPIADFVDVPAKYIAHLVPIVAFFGALSFSPPQKGEHQSTSRRPLGGLVNLARFVSRDSLRSPRAVGYRPPRGLFLLDAGGINNV